jgi:hypothetical protein
MKPLHWWKPRQVTNSAGILEVDFEGATPYSLLDAARDASALRALLDAQTDEQLSFFTSNWGLLYPRLKDGRWDRFPLDLLRLHRQTLLALGNLAESIRTGGKSIDDPLKTILTLDEEMRTRLYGTERANPLDSHLDAEERRLRDAGVPAEQLIAARYSNGRVSLEQHAAEILATRLDIPHRLRAVKTKRQWQFVQTPAPLSLEQVIRWSLLTRFRVIHYFLCESCGKEAVSFRSDARFCCDECSGRARVQRHRHNRPASPKSG